MKAITFGRYGSPEVLAVQDVPVPALGDDQVLIKVRAAEATKADCELRSFKFAVKWFWLPLRLMMGIRKPRWQILGGYFAGEIEQVGKGVAGYSTGDQVFGCCGMGFGAYAQYLRVPATATVVSKPSNMSFFEAAAVPLGGLNALHYMRRAQIQPGDQVLINGAGGSIGTHAVQIAKSMGAQVTAVDAGFKEPMVRNMGADHFIDYQQMDFGSGSARYDVVFDMVAGSSWSACLGVLSPGGRYLKGNPRLSDMLRAPLTNRFSDKTVTFAFAGEKQDELETLRTMIEAGEIVSIVDQVYSMEQAGEAHRRVECEQRCGAMVIEIDHQS